MSKREKGSNSSFGIHAHNAVKHSYEAKVIAESLQRGGRNPQLKGIIHEVLIKDSINGNPGNIVKGIKASLTNKSNAKTVDVVVTKGAKVFRRIQAKDTANSISRTVKQIQSGQYRSARILGTKETTKKLAHALKKAGASKPVKSSGVSSKTTEALAAKAGVTGTRGLGKACLNSAKAGAVAGAAIGAGIAAIKGIRDIKNSKKTIGEVALDVGKESIGGAISGACAGAASTACGAVVAGSVAAAGITGAGAVALTVGLPVVAAVGVGIGAKSLYDYTVSRIIRDKPTV